MLAWGPLYRAYGGEATFGVASIVALAACACAVAFARAPLVALGSARSH
jgi:hypothetical protein